MGVERDRFGGDIATLVRKIRLSSVPDRLRMGALFYCGFDRASQRLEAVNLFDFGKNNDPRHSTYLRLHSRNVAGEARGIRCILEKPIGASS